MTAAIYSRGIDEEQLEDVRLFFKELELFNIKYIVYHRLFENVKEPLQLSADTPVFSGYEDLGPEVEFIIGLGGDGTLLDTVALIRNKPISIIGINFGRLGFLASIGRDKLKQAIKALASRTYVTEKRSLIHLDADQALFGETPFGLNEFAISKRDTASMLKIHTYLNGEFLNTYWADGLIVATPTGSTGYSLSCGGPIVFPDCRNFIITPVAPHHLNMRSLVVNDDSIISFEVESRADTLMCSLDSRREIVSKNISLAVKKETFPVNFIRLGEHNFLQTIQTKLIWGLDRRN